MDTPGLIKMAELAKACGVSDQAIRLYEREGLLKPAARTPKGHRLFDHHAAEALRFIKQAQQCGFTLAEIRKLLAFNLSNPRACEATRSLLDQKLSDTGRQMENLQSMRDILLNLREACDGGPGPACLAFIRLNGSVPPEAPSKRNPRKLP